MSEAIVIAVKLLGECDDIQPEPFYINPGISWRDLRAMLVALYEREPQEVHVCYLDEDEDLCILSSDDELQEAFRYCSQTANVLQLNVRVVDSKPDVFKTEDVNVIHVNPHSLFTDADKEEMSLPGAVDGFPPACVIPRQTDGSPDLAETGEVAPKHVFDEETGLINTGSDQPPPLEPIPSTLQPVPIPYKQPPLKQMSCEQPPALEPLPPLPARSFSHEPVARKKACYYEIQGNDEACDEVDRLVKEVTDNLGSRQDQDSGELSSGRSEEAESMPYQAFVHFMEKLKQELRNEIVHDVTKKTVKHILKGLDTAWPFAARDRKETRSPQPLYLHEKIICNKCHHTIIGPRYKCGNCPDFDLCEECEGKLGVHNPDHVFIKLRRPCLEAGVKEGKKVPLLKHLLYADNTERVADEHEKLRAKKVAEKMARRQEKLKRREEKVQEKQKRKEDKLKRKLEKLDTNSSRDHPQKREKVESVGLMLPQFKYPYQVLGAEFVRDVTIPDYTHVQPGTRMQKTWRMKNTGSHQWSSSTQLRLMWGTIPAPKTEVSVPALAPQEEGDITVELIAPEEPGRYQSHWKLFDHGVNFGHRVWCSIAVEPKEVLEPKCEDQLKVVDSAEAEDTLDTAKEDKEKVERELKESNDDAQEDIFLEAIEEKPALEMIMATKLVPATVIKSEPEKVDSETATEVEAKNTKVTDSMATQVESDVLEVVNQMRLAKISEGTAVEGVADLLSFEFLDLADRKKSKASQTATPNNTPLDVTPPKSPAPECVIPATVSNSSSVELVGNEGEPDLPHLDEYVQQHMASLELKPDNLHDADIESLSSLSLSDEESDDYCIVPLPECFNTEVPLTRSTIGLLDDNQNEIGATDENLSEECNTTEQPTLDEILTTSSVVATPALAPKQADEVELATQKEIQPKVSEQVLVEEATDTKQKMVRESNEPLQTARVVDENQNMEDNHEGTYPVQSTPSEFVNQLFHTAIMAATKAGAKAYTTTKDVFTSMQAKQWKPNDSTWTPPKSTWTPLNDNYTPPQEDWTPPKETWIPPEDNYVPPQSTWTDPGPQQPRPATADPMVRLFEMGFCNREINRQLLDRFKNDLEPVIQELLKNADNDWHACRHGPSAQ